MLLKELARQAGSAGQQLSGLGEGSLEASADPMVFSLYEPTYSSLSDLRHATVAFEQRLGLAFAAARLDVLCSVPERDLSGWEKEELKKLRRVSIADAATQPLVRPAISVALVSSGSITITVEADSVEEAHQTLAGLAKDNGDKGPDFFSRLRRAAKTFAAATAISAMGVLVVPAAEPIRNVVSAEVAEAVDKSCAAMGPGAKFELDLPGIKVTVPCDDRALEDLTAGMEEVDAVDAAEQLLKELDQGSRAHGSSSEREVGDNEL